MDGPTRAVVLPALFVVALGAPLAGLGAAGSLLPMALVMLGFSVLGVVAAMLTRRPQAAGRPEPEPATVADAAR
jgi:MFS transporter, DHA1 family, multidrug resistance protein